LRRLLPNLVGILIVVAGRDAGEGQEERKGGEKTQS
jgi:hypothetical protein